MTASPLGKKGVSSVNDCRKQFSELESILDAKIYTIADRSEMDVDVPIPEEVKRFYDPNSFLYEDLKEMMASLLAKFDGNVLLLHNSLANQYSDIDDITNMSRKRLAKLHAKICFCLDNLGPICAGEAAKICLEDVLRSSVDEGSAFHTKFTSEWHTFLEETVNLVEGHYSEGYEALLKTKQGCIEAVKLGYLSPKLYELIQIFESFETSKQVHCLVFVERKIATKVIDSLIKKVGFLSHLAVSFLTGGTSSSDSLTRKMQRDTLDLFRSGKVNVLLSTDVVEEGLDVPSCSCVIRFDLPKTTRSYVQSRGRARQVGSHYIILLERGNAQQRDTLFSIVKSNHAMIDTAMNREPDDHKPKVCHSDTQAVYVVESTGASVTVDSSISLINRYCQSLPKDKYFIPKPVYNCTFSDGCYECVLTMPPNAAFKTIVGPLCQSSHLAKQLVSLEACKKLHQLGALNDRLLPCLDESISITAAEKTGVSSEGAGTTKRKELHSASTVSAMSGTWAHEKAGVTLQAYKLNFVCDQAEQNYPSFVLLIDTVLDDDVASMELKLYLVKKTVTAYMSPCGPIELDAEQALQAKHFHEIFFNGLFGKMFIGSKSSDVRRQFLFKEDNDSFWNISSMYFLLPLESSCANESNSIGINWKGISANDDVLKLMRNIYSSGAEDGGIIYPTCSSYKDEGCDPNTIHLANKCVSKEEVKDMVVLAIHTGKLYHVLDVSAESASSSFDGSKFETFADYFDKKYEIKLQHPEQPLLLLKQSHNPFNLLSSKSMDEELKKTKNEKQKPISCVNMPPELLAYIDFPVEVLKSLYLLPSLMHRLECLMLASQIRSEIGFQSKDTHISVSLILEAITTMRCCEDFSLERLELLGDSVLKYTVSSYLFLRFPKEHEGQLSSRRTRLVCNANLYRRGAKRNVQGYILDAPFDPRRWLAPGQVSLRSVPCACGLQDDEIPNKILLDGEDKSIVIGRACDKGHRWICSKTISDCAEALIGAYYVDGGLAAAIAVLKWLNINVDIDAEMLERTVSAASVWTCLPRMHEISILEEKLQYTFNVKGLLLEAITHVSQQELGAQCCYQRLEFLGDSVLDLLITQFLFNRDTDIDPGELTDLRSASVNNEYFAQVAVKNELQHHLLHNSELLLEQITKYVKKLDNGADDKYLLLSDTSSTGPKVLADIVESIAAAVLIDTKLDLNKVWEIFEPLFSPIVTSENLELPPYRELTELCSHHGYFMRWSCTNKGDSVAAMLEVQLKDVLLVRSSCANNRKAAKGQAAFLLLKDLEERGVLHSRYPSRRKQPGENVDNKHEMKLAEENPNHEMVVVDVDVCVLPEDTKAGSNKRKRTLKERVLWKVKTQKGGPRTGLYELCRKWQWPIPSFESTEEISRDETTLDQCPEGKNNIGFVSSITLHIPNSTVVEISGERCPDKKRSLDSAALKMLHKLDSLGWCQVEEI